MVSSSSEHAAASRPTGCKPASSPLGAAAPPPTSLAARDARWRRAAEVVWNWKSPQQATAARPLRRFAGTVLRDVAIGLVIATVLYASGRPVIAAVAAVVSVLVLAVRSVLPPSLSAPVIAFTGRIAQQAGHALTAILLGAIYITVFLPFRAWRTLTGQDSLQLRPRRPGQSFWIERSTLPETSPDKPY